jgi:hypothetical protein
VILIEHQIFAISDDDNDGDDTDDDGIIRSFTPQITTM